MTTLYSAYVQRRSSNADTLRSKHYPTAREAVADTVKQAWLAKSRVKTVVLTAWEKDSNGFLYSS